jgi:AcrR family transcriptional regulator
MTSLDRRTRERLLIQEKILDAAREQFLAGGYEAVSLRKIAEAIEYTAPAIYTHFKDKTDLLRALCRKDFASLDEVFLKMAKVADPVERIYRIGMAYIKFAHEHPKHYRYMFMTPGLAEIVPPTEEDLADMNNPDKDAYAFFHLTVRQAVESGRFRDEYADHELSAQTLWAGVHGVASLEVTHADCPWVKLRPLNKRSKSLCAAVLRGMLKNPAEMEAFL